MAWIKPIFDRTDNDVGYATYLFDKGYSNLTVAEKADWDSDLKGSLNFSDLNRIEGNMAILATDLSVTITTKTDWDVSDILSTTSDSTGDVQRITANLQTLCNAVTLPEGSPSVPIPPLNDIYKINDIESLINIINQTLPTPN
jgi:hypothetical protein